MCTLLFLRMFLCVVPQLNNTVNTGCGGQAVAAVSGGWAAVAMRDASRLISKQDRAAVILPSRTSADRYGRSRPSVFVVCQLSDTQRQS